MELQPYLAVLKDPQFAKYLRPFTVPKEEHDAEEWANETFAAVLVGLQERGCELPLDPVLKEEFYQGCLVGARRLMRDRDFYMQEVGCEETWKIICEDRPH